MSILDIVTRLLGLGCTTLSILTFCVILAQAVIARSLVGLHTKK